VSVVPVRVLLARGSIWLAFGTFVVYSVWGLYLGAKLARYRDAAALPKTERWNPACYAPGAERWLARDYAWHRWRTAVWLGCILIGNGLYLIFRP
jgi:hypothetical protein